jgi:hypothetical protein
MAMVKKIALATTMLGVTAASSVFLLGQTAAPAGRCLHGSAEQPNQRARRDLALKYAQQINQAEHSGTTLLPSQPKREYKPFAQLPNLGSAPAGFTLQFYSNTDGYLFALKDTLDACEFAIFSDQDKGLYEGTPQAGTRLLPAQTF